MNKEKQKELDAGIPKRNMKELTTNFFRFDELGQTVEGEVINIDKDTSQDFWLWSLKDDDGVVRKFHDSTQLRDLLAQVNVGDYISIEYIAKEPMAEGKTLKVFKVLRSE